MEKFEYYIVQLMFPIGTLNLKDLGEAGWELVSVILIGNDYNYYFKREIKE